jgi:putative acetyltransferase
MTIQNILIRAEKTTDFTVISEVTIAAFETIEISNHTEQFIIEALRALKALTISLVAEVDGRVVGHIAFSPVTMSDGTKDWYDTMVNWIGRHFGSKVRAEQQTTSGRKP